MFSVYGIQQFSEKPQDVAVIQGQTVVMKCAIQDRVGLIQWAKGVGTPIMLGKLQSIVRVPEWCMTLAVKVISLVYLRTDLFIIMYKLEAK